MTYDPTNPLIVQGDRSILVEVDNPKYAEARDALAPFAELEKSPDYLHTYRITPLSLWNAAAVGAFARATLLTIGGRDILAKSETARAFIRRTPVAGSSRALGWDTMLPTSSCGTLMSPRAFGHTGFTGTGTATTATVGYTFELRISAPANTTLLSGTYTDTITLTLTNDT